jgi:membrane protease YdiL (CAAX protease family)
MMDTAMETPAESRESTWRPWGPPAAIVGTVAIYFFGQLLGALVVGLIAWLVLHGQGDLGRWINGSVGGQFLYIAAIELFTIGLVWLALRRRRFSFRGLGLTKPHLGDVVRVLSGYGVYFIAFLILTALVRLAIPTLDLKQPQQIGFEQAHGLSLVLVFIGLVVLPPLTEEILFRGFLYQGLRSKLPKLSAALLTSLLFAVPHLQPFGGTPLVWMAAIDTFILSLVLIYLYESSGRLWASIGLHMVKNSIAFLALFILHAR